MGASAAGGLVAGVPCSGCSEAGCFFTSSGLFGVSFAIRLYLLFIFGGLKKGPDYIIRPGGKIPPFRLRANLTRSEALQTKTPPFVHSGGVLCNVIASIYFLYSLNPLKIRDFAVFLFYITHTAIGWEIIRFRLNKPQISMRFPAVYHQEIR